MSLGQRVRELREAKGMSQSELAQAIGKQMLAVSQIERGNTIAPRSDTLAGLAEALETSVDYLLHGREPTTTSEPVHDAGLNIEALWFNFDPPSELHHIAPEDLLP